MSNAASDPQQHLIETQHGHLTVLTMNRPQALNAFSPSMMAGFNEALPRLANDPDCRTLMLTGVGRAFSAGGDVKGFASNAESSDGERNSPSKHTQAPNEAERAAGLRQSTEIVELLHTMPKPTIAAIPGVAAGGGFSVALACDVRIASSDARFTTAFNKLGLSGDYGGTYFLTQLVGTAKARELYLTSDIIDVEEAHRIGIVNQVFEKDSFADEALAFAKKLAAMPPISSRLMKQNLNSALTLDLAGVLDIEATNMITCFDSNDHKAGALAFVTKKPAVFTGT
ncbi:MAG: enoyl-CoA hydratase-related protein [Gammaproteobacteria bacterium]|nr:enoyl-CoA hydratase-related protein [Gammaproteobacteria bacterium]